MKKLFYIIPLLLFSFLLLIVTNPILFPSEIIQPLRELRDYQQEITRETSENLGLQSNPQILDDRFEVEMYVGGLHQPTQMTIIDDKILVIEKNTGHVKLISNGILEEEPLLEFNVSTLYESGLLGITSSNSLVYLYMTEIDPINSKLVRNNLYKYEWDGNSLINPSLLLTLENKASWHNGGGLVANQNDEIFLIIGDQIGETDDEKLEYSILQNSDNEIYDDSGVIIKIKSSDKEIRPSSYEDPLLYYYAIGIRNSFGLAIDPITQKIWDTENGPETFDEINLVDEKFNSGWNKVTGPSNIESINDLKLLQFFNYSEPEFSWERTVAPTGLFFLNSEIFGEINNNMVVGSCNTGELYIFKLDPSRNKLIFEDNLLKDNVVNLIENENSEKIPENYEEILFGNKFGCITDVESNDNGLFIVSITENAIYRIFPKN